MIDCCFFVLICFWCFLFTCYKCQYTLTRNIDIIAVAGNSGMVGVGEGIEVGFLCVFFIFVFVERVR
jgi:hypothetical protein